MIHDTQAGALSNQGVQCGVTSMTRCMHPNTVNRHTNQINLSSRNKLTNFEKQTFLDQMFQNAASIVSTLSMLGYDAASYAAENLSLLRDQFIYHSYLRSQRLDPAHLLSDTVQEAL